jgi:hypothetical protein
MTIAKGRELLEKSDVDVKEFNKAIAALEWEWRYIRNMIELGLRDEASGLENIGEIKRLINQLNERLCNTN